MTTMLVSPLKLAHDVEEVGSKAVSLAALMHSGVRVPPSLCVTTRGMASLDRPEFRDELSRQLPQLGSERLAVRSSAAGEDGVHHSYAGIFTSVLDVAALPEPVIEALRAVRDSLDGAAAEAYRVRRSLPRTAMAALVQRMLKPLVSGVLFTRDPVTGASNYLVEATEQSPAGGDPGASGGGHFTMTAHGELLDSGGALQRVVSDGLPVELAAIGRRCEEVGGSPQDVEWAVADGELWVLQSRPISA
jgi:phosphoenolpyruvate synthase/pyruvate phosphate dikinase